MELLLIVLIILVVILMSKVNNAQAPSGASELELAKIETLLEKYGNDIKSDIKKDLGEGMLQNNERIQDKLIHNHKETQQTIASVQAKVAVLQKAQEGIEGIHTDLKSLQQVLTDKGSRGGYGEVQLYTILEQIFGSNEELFARQYKLDGIGNVDAAIFGGEVLGIIPIDSKFPLENYVKMIEAQTELEKEAAQKEFKSDIKKRIDETAKYIVPGTTSEMAIMFIPSEAIFAEVNSHFADVILYAQKKNVWVASPTTIMAILTLIQQTVRDVKRDKNIKVIQKELSTLAVDFERFNTRWEGVKATLATLNKKVDEEDKSVDKIVRKFDKITDSQIKE